MPQKIPPPPVGRQGEQAIRSMLASIRKFLQAPSLKTSQALKLLDHQQRLQAELKIVCAEKIKKKLAQIDGATETKSLGAGS